MKKREIIEIPPTILPDEKQQGQLRGAAYCRVSTNQEEQQNSYEAQIPYYTRKIAENPDWILAGIFSDACVIIGLTGKTLAATGLAPF